MNMSLWKAMVANPPTYPSLQNTIDVDVAIVGGGITGITAAYHLMEQGKSVAVIEADGIGSGTTAYSTGNLYVPVQPYFYNIVAKFNREAAKQVAHARSFAIDRIEEIVQKEHIACHFHRRPWFLYTNDPKEISRFDKEAKTFRDIGLDYSEIKEMPLPFKFMKAIELQNQARFNPYKYVVSVAARLAKKGCHIFENTRVLSFSEKKQCQLVTEHGKVNAGHVLLATHTPIGINTTQVFTAPYRSYVIAVKLADHRYPEGHFWDLATPHHVVCTHPYQAEKPELLMISGSHHKTGQDKDEHEHYKILYDFARTNFDVETIEFKWSAQHYQSADSVPYIGLQSRMAKRIYMATGYFADGLVYGTLAGFLFAETIAGNKNGWDTVFNSLRFKPAASAAFLAKENSNVMVQYLKDLPLAASKFSSISKGQAKVVEVDREKYAAYRDDNDQLHVVSAVCTHMKCIVSWNNAETSWDCPCHGSRFDIHGNIIEGPALANLRKKAVKES